MPKVKSLLLDGKNFITNTEKVIYGYLIVDDMDTAFSILDYCISSCLLESCRCIREFPLPFHLFVQ
jgi:hypothetical protein